MTMFFPSWVYYSSLIFFLGAEFTQVYPTQYAETESELYDEQNGFHGALEGWNAHP